MLTYTCYLYIPKKTKFLVSDDEAFIVRFCNGLCTLACWNISDADRFYFIFYIVFGFVNMHLYCNKGLFFALLCFFVTFEIWCPVLSAGWRMYTYKNLYILKESYGYEKKTIKKWKRIKKSTKNSNLYFRCMQEAGKSYLKYLE